MARFICFLACLVFARPSLAQFYYQDIVSTNLTNGRQKLLRINSVKRVMIRSMDPGGAPDAAFFCEENIDRSFRKTTSKIKSIETGISYLISYFDDSDRITLSEDSTSSSLSITTYQYNEKGNLIKITIRSTAPGLEDTAAFSESHIYFYNEAGFLDSMVRKKNNQVYSLVKFEKDSSGFIISEQESMKGHQLPPFYYKYSPDGKLTDIVQYNPTQDKMLATRMFDYNGMGQQTEMTTVLSDTNGYTLWKYDYNEKGLVSREECLQKGNELVGILTYSYAFQG